MNENASWTASWMEEEHVLLQQSVRKFFAEELVPNLDRWRNAGIVDREMWLKAGNAGFLGASVPVEYGGSGGTAAFDVVIAYEQARAGDSGWAWGVHNICTHYILGYGTEEQKTRWLPGLASGEIVPAIAMTEPGTGSDLQAVKTYAEKSGDDYVINGSKTFISNGQAADIVIVVAKTDKAARAKGISLVVVETENCKGFMRGRNLEKIGMKGQDTSELSFDDVRVPSSNLLGGKEGQGFIQLMSQLPWERLQIGVGALGASEMMVDETLSYVKERKAFGQRLMDMQNTRFKLAEAKTKLEVTRAFIDQCVEKLVRGDLDAATGSMAKWWGSQIQCEIADECLQLHGGYGYMMEYPIARAYADARVQKIYGGANEIQKELIARSMDAEAK